MGAVRVPQRGGDRRRRLQRQVAGHHVDVVPGLQEPDGARQADHTGAHHDHPGHGAESALPGRCTPVGGDAHATGCGRRRSRRRTAVGPSGSPGSGSGCRGAPGRRRRRRSPAAVQPWPQQGPLELAGRHHAVGHPGVRSSPRPAAEAARSTRTRATSPSTYPVQVIRPGRCRSQRGQSRCSRVSPSAAICSGEPLGDGPLEAVHRLRRRLAGARGDRTAEPRGRRARASDRRWGGRRCSRTGAARRHRATTTRGSRPGTRTPPPRRTWVSTSPTSRFRP